MPKSARVRATENPLGQKINAVMAEKNMAGDYAQLAQIFEVATPSTYDWITHGRLGKERYKRLVEWSGRSLNWWFDIPAGYEQAQQASTQVGESVSVYPIKNGERWPFSVDLDLVRKLDSVDIALIEGYIRAIVDVRRVDARKSR